MHEDTIIVQDDEDLDEDLDNSIPTKYEESKGAVVVPVEEHIKTIYYRFDKSRFFKN